MKPYKTKFKDYNDFEYEVIKNGAKIYLTKEECKTYVNEYCGEYAIELEFADENTVLLHGERKYDNSIEDSSFWAIITFYYEVYPRDLWFYINI